MISGARGGAGALTRLIERSSTVRLSTCAGFRVLVEWCIVIMACPTCPCICGRTFSVCIVGRNWANDSDCPRKIVELRSTGRVRHLPLRERW